MTVVDAPAHHNGGAVAPETAPIAIPSTSKDDCGDETVVDAASRSFDATYESTQLPTSTEPDSRLGTRQPHQARADAAPVATQQTLERAPWITFACYFVAAVATLTVSLNTSWRFFGEVLHISTANGERLIMFAVAEMALIVCGAGMAVNVRRTGQPGSFRMVVWGMCAVSAYMAWAMSNFEEGLARVILGPLLGTIMLHLALGVGRWALSCAPATTARELSPASSVSCGNGCCHGSGWPMTNVTRCSARATEPPSRPRSSPCLAAGAGRGKRVYSGR